MNYKHSLFESEFFGSIIAIRIFSRLFIASYRERERKTQWETKANISNPARLRQRADEQVSRFKEKVDNSEKNAKEWKKIMRIKKWSILPGPVRQNNSLGDAAEKRPNSPCMII